MQENGRLLARLSLHTYYDDVNYLIVITRFAIRKAQSHTTSIHFNHIRGRATDKLHIQGHNRKSNWEMNWRITKAV